MVFLGQFVSQKSIQAETQLIQRPTIPHSVPTYPQALYELRTPRISPNGPETAEISRWSQLVVMSRGRWYLLSKVDVGILSSPLLAHTKRRRLAYPT